MRRPLTIAILAILAVVFLYACASTIRTANTSFVTITIGNTPNTALLKAEAATPWTRLKHYLADAKWMSEAYAYIPSVVQVLVVTVTASDITTPIVGVSSVSPAQTTATLRIEVPNGAARTFVIEGIHGMTSAVTYRASTEADLDGTDITLPITMQFNYSGSAIFVDELNGDDQLYSGLTYTRPLRTITRALSLQSTSTPYSSIPVIYVEQGNYVYNPTALRENFPLLLNPNTAIVCGGRGFTSVIGGGAVGSLIIRGNEGASIDNCKIVISTNSSIGINDLIIVGQTPTPTRTRINGVKVEISGASTDIMRGVVLSGDSTLIESEVTTSTPPLFSVTGVEINGGKPQIIASSVSALATGIDLTSGANDAIITGSSILNHSTAGINVATSAKPQITGNTISNNNTGILIVAGEPQISGNIIDYNDVGVEVTPSAVKPVIMQNSIFCSFNADLFSTATFTLDVRNNSWDHDSTTVPPGPEERISVNGRWDCAFGADLCAQNGPMPQYLPANAAVPNGCLFPSPN